MEDGKKKKPLWLLLLLLCLLTAAGALLYIVIGKHREAAAEREMERIRQMEAAESMPDPEPTLPAPEAEPTAADARAEAEVTPFPTPVREPGRELPQIPERIIDWESLQKENPDIYAWVCVPDTDVDYPVLQHPSDDSFYLNHNLDGSYGNPGCIYTEKEWNSKDFTDPNTVLYGHNFNDDRMFSTLHRFDDGAFFEGDHYIFVFREDGDPLAYLIFAAYETNAMHLLANGDMHNEYVFADYLKNIRTAGSRVVHYRDDIELTTEDRLITLSTCPFGAGKDKRYLVQGVLLNPEAAERDAVLPAIDLE
ncbi:MAG: sortase [Lachnospiraceae bacterium]|nr:sortase [Lachnospiraceae bacterium]